MSRTVDPRLASCIIPETGTIRDAMLALDRGAVRIALAVAADGRLTGIATDGDIRRALLAGRALDDPIGPVLTRRFAAVGPTEGRSDVIDLMRARAVSSIPVVGPDGRPVGLHLIDRFIEPVERRNHALVMAGGEGRRLRPMTETVPKPMLRVAGRPILERIVLQLVGHGLRDIWIAVNYLGDQIEDHFGDGSRFGVSIHYLRESRPLGTGGAIGLLPESLADPLLVMNGDLVTQADLGSLLDLHDRDRNAVTIGVRRYLHAIPFGCVEVADGRITALDEKPILERDINTGIYAIDPSVAARVARDEPIGMPDLITDAIDRGERVGAFRIEDDWLDIGERDQLDLARGRV